MRTQKEKEEKMKQVWIVVFAILLCSLGYAVPITTEYNILADELINSTDANWTIYASGTDMYFNTSYWSSAGKQAILVMPFDANYSGYNVPDIAGFDQNGTVTGATYTATGGVNGNGAYVFAGGTTNNYIYTNSINTSVFVNDGQVSISWEGWIYANHTGSPRFRPLDTDDYGIAPDEGVAHSFLTYVNSNSLYCIIQNTTSGELTDTIAFTVSNSWKNFACTFNGTHMTAYLNGVSSGSPALWTKGNLKLNTSLFTRICIGSAECDGSASEVMNGTIDDVRIYNWSLSAEQIYADYQCGNGNLTWCKLLATETTAGEYWTGSMVSSDETVYGAVSSKTIYIRADCNATFVCDSYSCTTNNTDICSAVSDSSGCNNTYAGNYTEFTLECEYCEQESAKDSVECYSYKSYKEGKMIPIAILLIALMFWFIYIAQTLNVKNDAGQTVAINLFIKTLLYGAAGFFAFFISGLAFGFANEMGLSNSLKTALGSQMAVVNAVSIIVLFLILIGVFTNVTMAGVAWLRRKLG